MDIQVAAMLEDRWPQRLHKAQNSELAGSWRAEHAGLVPSSLP